MGRKRKRKQARARIKDKEKKDGTNLLSFLGQIDRSGILFVILLPLLGPKKSVWCFVYLCGDTIDIFMSLTLAKLFCLYVALHLFVVCGSANPFLVPQTRLRFREPAVPQSPAPVGL